MSEQKASPLTLNVLFIPVNHLDFVPWANVPELGKNHYSNVLLLVGFDPHQDNQETVWL